MTTYDRKTRLAAAAAVKKADKLVEAAYYRRCRNIPIDIMDIGKVFAVGRKALAEGCSLFEMEERVAAYVESIRWKG